MNGEEAEPKLRLLQDDRLPAVVASQRKWLLVYAVDPQLASADG
jgi:hypothetical protein